jgi:hypothetical protein
MVVLQNLVFGSSHELLDYCCLLHRHYPTIARSNRYVNGLKMLNLGVHF